MNKSIIHVRTIVAELKILFSIILSCDQYFITYYIIKSKSVHTTLLLTL